MGGGRRVFWKNTHGIFIENGTGICLIVSPHPSLSIYFWRTFMHRINKTKTDVYYLICTYYIVVPPNLDVEYGIGRRSFKWRNSFKQNVIDVLFAYIAHLLLHFSFIGLSLAIVKIFASYLIKRFLTFTTYHR